MSWSGSYDGSALPQSSSPAWTRAVSGTPTTESVSGGVLHIANSYTGYLLYSIQEASPTTYDVGYAEAVVKYASGDSASSDVMLQLRLKGRGLVVVRISSSTQIVVTTYDSSFTPTEHTVTVGDTTSAFHTLRIDYDLTNGWRVSWDGSVVYTATGSQYTSQADNVVYFGDASAAFTQSDSYWDSVTFSATPDARHFVTLTPATETDTAVAASIRTRVTLTPATETDAAVALVLTGPTTLARVRSGLVSDNEWPDTLNGNPGWQSVAGATLGGTDGAQTIATTATSEMVGAKRTVDLRHSGYESTTDLQLDTDWAICVDVPAGGANNAYSGVVIAKQDDSNYYALRVSKTNGGTSSLVEVTAGTPATRASATADVHTGTQRVKLYRKGGTRWGAVVAGQHFYYDDASPPGSPLLAQMGAQAAAGTSAYTYSNLDICIGNTVEVAGLTTGEAVRIYDAAGTLVASAVESGGVATLDLSAQTFPFTGFVRVFTDNTYATQASAANRWPGLGTAQFRGGDRLHAHFGSDAETAGLKVVTNEAHNCYATIQYNSRSGIVHDGAMYGLVMGKRGKVFAYKLDLVTGQTVDYVYVGDCADQHDSLDMTVDGNGYLHIVYGGTYSNAYRTENSTYHRVSAQPWSVKAWQARTDLGKRFALLSTDKNGAVHMIGGVFGTYLADIKHRIWSGGSWGSETTIIQRAAATGGAIGWNNYPCDFAPSRNKGRLHLVGYSYGDPGGVSTWRNAWHLYYDVDAAAWKKIDGSTITLPATQDATTGAIAAIDTFQSGDAYTPIVTVDANGNLWAVVPSGAGVVAQRSHYLYKGVPGVGWSSSIKTFQNVWSKGCLAFTGNGSGLVFIAPAAKTSAMEIPWDIRRWTCEDGTATTAGSTWTEKVMYDGSLDGGRHYWPRMAVVDGEDYFKVLWHSRYTLYGADPVSASVPTMDGVSTVYLADIAARLSLIPATETDAAQTLTHGRAFTITPATETDAAVTLSWDFAATSQTVTLTPATETDTAVGLSVSSGVHTLSLTPALEADAAVTLTIASSLTGPAIPLPATANFVSARSQTANFVSPRSQTADFVPGAS